MPMHIIEGNLLEAEERFIAHQCNCISIGSAGLAKSLFRKFPYANVYCTRKKRGEDKMGTITVCGNGSGKRYVINMFAQYNPGGPDKGRDSPKGREFYFALCLRQIVSYNAITPIVSIAFPFKIGCGLAGGSWNNYFKMLNDFSDKNGFEVTIYKL
jgi:O-acetyl-ADP-ribose deacetylase (regulator of RNase III)